MCRANVKGSYRITRSDTNALLGSNRTALGFLSASVLVTGLHPDPAAGIAMGSVLLSVGLIVYTTTAWLYLVTNRTRAPVARAACAQVRAKTGSVQTTEEGRPLVGAGPETDESRFEQRAYDTMCVQVWLVAMTVVVVGSFSIWAKRHSMDSESDALLVVAD